MSIDTDQRVHDHLRNALDDLCAGILPCIGDKIKHTVRQAYYLGCADGLQFAKDVEEDQVEGMRHNHAS